MNMQRKADQNTKQCMSFFPKWKPNYRRIPKVALIVNPPIEVQKYPPPPLLKKSSGPPESGGHSKTTIPP